MNRTLWDWAMIVVSGILGGLFGAALFRLLAHLIGAL